MNESVSHLSHSMTGIYCAGCNERFILTGDSLNCPQCGAELAGATDNFFGDTMLIKPAPRDNSVPAAELIQQDLVGTVLHVYRCESLLGRGGMGQVYLAFHRDLHRYCALKVLSPRLMCGDPEFKDRFLAEGRAAAALVHPNIVTTHAIGEAGGLFFLEMEFIPGRSLQSLVDEEGRLTPIRAAALCTRIAEGLAAAHREGIVHRDLKLDNVLLTQTGIPKIADFGLAKRVQRRGSAPGSSQEPLCGTPNYMAPELFRGLPASPASDVYALGVCFYVLLTGRLPYVGGSLNALQSSIIDDPLPNVRQGSGEITLEMAEGLSLLLAKSPENRPRDGIEAAQLLHAILGQIRDIESLLREAFPDDKNVCWTRSGNQYRVQLNLPDGRQQSLFIEPSEHSTAERLLLIYSVCCRAQPAYYEDALRLNSQISHGGIAIREIDGESYFIVVDTYPRATVDAEEVRRSVLEVAMRSDAVEWQLTGRDEF